MRRSVAFVCVALAAMAGCVYSPPPSLPAAPVLAPEIVPGDFWVFETGDTRTSIRALRPIEVDGQSGMLVAVQTTDGPGELPRDYHDRDAFRYLAMRATPMLLAADLTLLPLDFFPEESPIVGSCPPVWMRYYIDRSVPFRSIGLPFPLTAGANRTFPYPPPLIVQVRTIADDIDGMGRGAFLEVQAAGETIATATYVESRKTITQVDAKAGWDARLPQQVGSGEAPASGTVRTRLVEYSAGNGTVPSREQETRTFTRYADECDGNGSFARDKWGVWATPYYTFGATGEELAFQAQVRNVLSDVGWTVMLSGKEMASGQGTQFSFRPQVGGEYHVVAYLAKDPSRRYVVNAIVDDVREAERTCSNPLVPSNASACPPVQVQVAKPETKATLVVVVQRREAYLDSWMEPEATVRFVDPAGGLRGERPLGDDCVQFDLQVDEATLAGAWAVEVVPKGALAEVRAWVAYQLDYMPGYPQTFNPQEPSPVQCP